MSDWPRANASNSPTLAFQPTIAMKTKNIVPRMGAESANAARIAQRRVPLAVDELVPGLRVDLGRVHGHDREDDRDQHRDAEEQEQRVIAHPLAPLLPLAP